ncbi:hypothetical protein MSG28_012398 [Choristoneura fumiferana]|uniref:Uncharacterized protein n=1 Tax=Choristoneura fumiferana TaxID=7141 RepID=A0ACC0KCT6_CHOFU|nr:hypothetical protein MSG28_012398 [Choristoneura fumiferana]
MLDDKLATVKRDLAKIDSKLTTTKQEIFIEMKNEFESVLDRLKREFTDTTDFLNEELKSTQSDLNTLKKKIKDIESDNSRLNAELQTIKKHQICNSYDAETQNVISQLQSDLNDKDQLALLNDLEINGVPEHRGESTVHIVQALAMKIGVTLEDRDVVSSERVGPWRADGAATDTRPRSRPLVVRLARRTLRDELLQSARARRGLDSGNMTLPQHNPQPVYVNERLTKMNRIILWKARQAKISADWTYVWTKEGRIYAKRTEGKDNLNDKDQLALLNDLEINGVPEHRGESTVHIVQALAMKIGVTLEDRDVVSSERVGPGALTDGAATDTRPRSRPLVVRLARRTLRDELLQSARARRGLDSGNMTLPQHNPNQST